VAANAFAEAFPQQGETLDLCPTGPPSQRRGWPPLPGDYHTVRFRAAVAVCTLNSDELAEHLAQRSPEGLAIVGTMRTENLGIERLIRNVLANPHIRFLVICGQDTQQTVGHLPGQSLSSLFKGGLDERGRIRGARGKRPVLKNASRDQVDAFLRQVELLASVGTEEEDTVVDLVQSCLTRDPGPIEGAPADTAVETLQAGEPQRLTQDPAGYFVIYPDAPRRSLIVEHYTNDGVLDCVIEGRTPEAVYSSAIERNLVSRLDHAAYLGRELALAARSTRTGEPYTQDRAPGELVAEPGSEACGCSTAVDKCRGTR
jgi:tetrahydromethanopterin S-methyltransferase subunit A